VEKNMPKEFTWNDAEEIGIQLQEKYPEIDPLTVRFTDLHRYVTELPGFADDKSKSNESKLEAIQMAWYDEHKDASS
jgi:FeS assembly protein IscX